jgi:hypothetical protein
LARAARISELHSIPAGIRASFAKAAICCAQLGAVEEGKGELFAELEGAPVFYDAWSKAVSLQMLASAGFSIVGHDLHSIDETKPSNGHLIVLAKAE